LIARTFYITLGDESLLVAQVNNRCNAIRQIALQCRNARAITTLLRVARNEFRFSRTDGGAPTESGFRSSQGRAVKLF